jgi:ribosome-associated heat shock protein Hsp15
MNPSANTERTDSGNVRIDQWLWAARFFKTRALAQQAIDNGRVDVNGQRAKRSRALRQGDEVRVRRGDEIVVVQVLELSIRRGSAGIAARLYRETEASVADRLAQADVRRLNRASYTPPPGKPHKRDRRSLLTLLDYHGAQIPSKD